MYLFRFINGSTALHTAAYFGAIPVVKELLSNGMDINILDYKGATALHRAKDTDTMKVSQCKFVVTNFQSVPYIFLCLVKASLKIFIFLAINVFALDAYYFIFTQSMQMLNYRYETNVDIVSPCCSF
jgi:hypothetical protein